MENGTGSGSPSSSSSSTSSSRSPTSPPSPSSPSSTVQWPVLHECVFKEDVGALSNLLHAMPNKESDIGAQDGHGNTALHLAVLLGKKDHAHLLVAHGAGIKVKNKKGWSPLAEAISYGDRKVVLSLLRKLKADSKQQLRLRKPAMMKALAEIDDCVIDVKWDFTSWIPLVSKVLPSDLCKVTKKGTAIRLDTTLVDFTDMRWERGDISFIYKVNAESTNFSLVILDNKAKVYQKVNHEGNDLELEDEVDLLMSGDIVSAQISTKPIQFAKAQSGWIFKADRSETVGKYKAMCYTMNGIMLETRKRREHLSKEDIDKNKALIESLSQGKLNQSEASNLSEVGARKESLPPPPPTSCTWEDYVKASPGNYPTLGRPQVCKETVKSFKATVSMSEEFPLNMEMFLNVLEIFAPQFKHFQKLRDFIQLKLPPGFPVKLDIPVLPTVSGRVTFQDFQWNDSISDDLFNIPSSYHEDPTRFPDL